MSEFWVIRSGNVLRPAEVESAADFSRLPVGKPLRVKIDQPRNGAHHRLYWVLCQRIANAIGCDAENVSDILKIQTGHCTVIKSKTMGELRLPKSIAFSKMDQTRFREFYDRCVDVICSEWGSERRDVLAAVEDLLVPTEVRGSTPELQRAGGG